VRKFKTFINSSWYYNSKRKKTLFST